LAEIDDIDSGEQLLLAILLAEKKDRILVSGDKRCMAAFKQALPDECGAAQSSIITFERCIRAITETCGFELVLDRAHHVRQCDASLRLAFGSNPSVDEFLLALESFDPLTEAMLPRAPEIR
jgi:hypothetical protein